VETRRVTRSAHHRTIRNALRIVAAARAAVTPRTPRFGELSVQPFVIVKLDPFALAEMREEGINWSLVAERLNPRRSPSAPTRAPESDERYSRFRSAHPSLRELRGHNIRRCPCQAA
jgi:hypothetical protein